ncbi:VanZ family protein [Bacillus suaedaesalsae]|uniref:VanZ family protein n=1 Tax=Bacillus suaedaesalsae TaxID=2810349 RepID=A0ABS2DDR4_9BACI|nr:VanZ family protein [Bacillus suaedaesalsae]MBM6616594.1 VanZ family protein [Bacillus suaedaesalsae]
MKDSIMITINSWYVLVPALVVFLFAMVFKARKFSVKQCTLLVTFAIYVAGVIHFTFFPIDVNIGMYANQTPWYKTINYIPILTIDVQTFLLNIIMFIPLGMFLPFLNQENSSVKRITTIGFYSCLSIELLQCIIKITLGSGRSTDINDLLTNTLGAVIGYYLVNKVMKIKILREQFDTYKLHG